MSERGDVAVIGAGVIGLAVARNLAQAGRDVVVLEAAPAIGTHSSSRNSEVIHAGIYYPPGSLKARLCVRGKELLYRYCESRGVPFRRLGKLLLAVEEGEVAALASYKARAEANGVSDLVWLGRQEVAALEPAVEAVAGLLSPSTGIIDSHSLMLALRGDAERAGAAILLSMPVVGGRIHGDGGIALSTGGGEPGTVTFRTVINCAGLYAWQVARSLAGLPPGTIPGQFLAKGHYFMLAGASPFSRLVYPLPEPGGLGVHVTLDLAGRVRFGPDVSWVDRIDYSFDESRAPSFYRAIRRYFPRLPEGALSPGYTGIRPKLAGEGAPAQDFLIQGPGEHGVPGLVNLYGIESPGLTACLAIAEHVAADLRRTALRPTPFKV